MVKTFKLILDKDLKNYNLNFIITCLLFSEPDRSRNRPTDDILKFVLRPAKIL